MSDKKSSLKKWNAAIYARLSREDGDKIDSDSIKNQILMLENYIVLHPGLALAGKYCDDGFTGTNFDRPDFRRMIQDIEIGKINCVIVKDLSRFGRDYIDTGRYLERYFPCNHVRFIAVNDNIDSEEGPYDMLLPVRNIFNEQYARDISKKVRSAVRTKQIKGDFIGAFPCYGYKKDPSDKNHLLIDSAAAETVRRIFDLYEGGTGQIKIAKLLNDDSIPCPSEYKKLCGEKYNNGRKLSSTAYWTYSTVHRILRNELYTGVMVQGRSIRQSIHGSTQKADEGQWIKVQNTHEAIIPSDRWHRVQELMDRRIWQMQLDTRRTNPFSGFLKCGDCGRAMCRTSSRSGDYFCCGSYRRYGADICSRHSISAKALSEIITEDLNKIIARSENIEELIAESASEKCENTAEAESKKLSSSLDRVQRLKKSSYEDFIDGILSRQEFLAYRADYQKQEQMLKSALSHLEDSRKNDEENPWVDYLLKNSKIKELDRITVAEAIKEIRIFEGGNVEITYRFEDDMGLFNESSALKHHPGATRTHKGS